jgi:hypothetical protein
MTEKLLKEVREVYKTPRIEVRGVFLCEDVAIQTSVKVNPIMQNDWATPDEWVGHDNWDGDIDLRF